MATWYSALLDPPKGRFIALVKETNYRDPEKPITRRTAEFCYYVDGIGYVLENTERFNKPTILSEITHWMEIPDFPKEAENETR